MERISYKEFNDFAHKMEVIQFFHGEPWTNIRRNMGWECEYLGHYENGELIFTCVAHLKPLPKLKYKMLYIPKGMIIDYNNQNHLRIFASEIRKYAKSKKAYVIKIDPEYKRYDIDLEGNPQNEETKVIKNLESVGFKHLGFYNNFEGINGRHTFILYYNGRTKEELFKLLKSNDRSKIKKSKELGVYLEDGTKKELDDFMEVMEITAKRGGYHVRSREFFELIMDNFPKENLRLVFTKINLNDYVDILNNNIKDLNSKLDQIKEKLQDEELSNKKKRNLTNEQNQSLKQLKKYNEDIEYAKEMKQKYQKDIITLSTSLYVYYEGRVYYWYSGSNSDFRNLRAVKVQMWDIIEDSVEKGYQALDFMGTSGVLDPKDKNYGLYEFKKSFGGEWEEYIGEFDLVIHPFIYKVANTIIPRLQTSQDNTLIRIIKKLIK